MNKKNNEAAEKAEKMLARVIKKSANEKIPDFLKINDIQILMPLEVTLMRSDLTRIQLSVLLSLIEKLAYKLKEKISMLKLEKENNLEFGQDGLQLVLWKDEEFSINKNNKRTFRLQLYYKEVGVKRNHYDQLESSIKALAGIPINFPVKENDGKSYTKFTNFCDVFIPQNQTRNIYCIVEFEEEVAKALTKMDFGYHYVGKKASMFFGNRSKYCERIYFLIQGFKNRGTVTLTTEEFRKQFGLTKKYKNYSSIKSGILDVSAKEIKRVFLLGGCECWFEYREIYRGNKTSGDPYQIKFIIHKDDDESRIDKQLAVEESAGRERFKEILSQDLHLSPKYIEGVIKRLTDENCQAAISSALKIKLYIDSGNVENPTFYAVKSLSNFFEDDELSRKNATSSSTDHFERYRQFIQEICRSSRKEDAKNIYSQMLFDSFLEKEKVLVIRIPDKDLAEKVGEHSELVTSLLGKYFGEGIEIKYKIKK